MPIGRTWYTLADAASKYCLDISLILKLVDQGLIRAEQVDTRLMQINVNDLELKVQEANSIR
jgi:hypothetical protein